MATRNLTGKYEGFRTRFRSRSGGSGRAYGARGGSGAGEVLLSDTDDISIKVGLQHSLPPEWVDIVEGIQGDISDIKGKMRELQQLHSSRLDVSFGEEEARTEREIEILTAEITRLFHKAENGLKRIATVGNAQGTNLPAQERVVRLNVMRSLAADMQALSKKFRAQQREFVMSLKSQEEVGDNFGLGDDESKEPLSFSEALDRGFTRENMQQLEEIEQTATEREREIIKIAQSINELANLFRELQVLVIEQGSVVDRIDYNVEQVLTKVKAGNVELKKADDYSKKARSIICILILLVICIILIGILIYQNQDKGDDSSKKRLHTVASQAVGSLFSLG